MAKENKAGRIKVPLNKIDHAKYLIGEALIARLKEKGYGRFSSRHEVQGIIDEEWFELLDALKTNDMEKYKKELIDLAVACHFGLACIEAGLLEW